MTYRVRSQYSENLLSTDVLGPSRVVSAPWRVERATFLLEVIRLNGNGASVPKGETAVIRNRYYECFFQGVFGESVFYEHRALFGLTYVSPPISILELVQYLHGEVVPTNPAVVPEIKLIVPLNHRVELQSLSLGYRN